MDSACRDIHTSEDYIIWSAFKHKFKILTLAAHKQSIAHLSLTLCIYIAISDTKQIVWYVAFPSAQNLLLVTIEVATAVPWLSSFETNLPYIVVCL
jgi:hypothetical protein